MKFKIILTLLLFSVALSFGQSKKWTLEECVAYAVDNNLTIEQFELDFSR